MAKKSSKTIIVGQDGRDDSFVYHVQNVRSLQDYKNMLQLATIVYPKVPIAIIYTNSKWLKTMTSEEVLTFQELNSQLNVRSFVKVGKFKSKNASAVVSLLDIFDTFEEFEESRFFEKVGVKVFFVLGDVEETERVVDYIKGSTSHTVSLTKVKSITNNIDVYRSFIKPQTKLMIMLKANAYGCGLVPIGRMTNVTGVDYVGVFSIDEGIELRNNYIAVPIMVMNVHPEDFNLCLKYDLEASIFNLDLLKEFVDRAEGRKCKIHLKVDTGMSRLGFNEMDDFEKALNLICQHDNIKLVSVYSHLACSDEQEKDEKTEQQVSRYLEFCELAENLLGYKFLKHILNSAGVLRLPHYQFDMVRSGIGIYGGLNHMDKRLKTVRSLISEIISVKKIKAGQAIGYGSAAVFDEDKTIGVVPIGYADGYRRIMGNGVGRVYINEHFAPVVGNICMDMFMVDLSGLDIKVGDAVEIFGENIALEEIAEKWNTIPYEVLTSYSHRANKKYIIDFSEDTHGVYL
ncbi:MAG: alanine racemase [Bacteroidales bacterium]